MSLSKESILKIFRKTEALLDGHFLLTSGLHSNAYFQCAKVFQYPWHAETLCREIADHFKNERIDTVVSPAVGGIVMGQEIGRLLKVRAIFMERVEGTMTLRRGFQINPGERILVAEDVTTTGGSVEEVIQGVRHQNGEVVAVTAIVDRSGGQIDFNVPYFSLLKMEVFTYPPDDCPLCRQGSQVIKPGSRNLK